MGRVDGLPLVREAGFIDASVTVCCFFLVLPDATAFR